MQMQEELESGVDFETMLNESFAQAEQDELTEGTIVALTDEYAIIDVGQKIEGRIPLDEIRQVDGTLRYKIGDKIPVVQSGYSGDYPVLSHRKAVARQKNRALIDELEGKNLDEATLRGKVVSYSRGGFTIQTADGCELFMPRSQAAYRENPKELIGKEVTVSVIKTDKSNDSIVVSRKRLLDAKRRNRKKILKRLLEDKEIVKGVIKKITSYGMFVDVGGIDGLVHYSEISYKGPVNPASLYKEGEEIEVKAIDYDPAKNRLSLSIKATMEDPWEEIRKELAAGDIIKVVVSNIENYGAFVDLGNDIEGFLHISELGWQKNIKHPKEILKIGEEIDVEVIEINPDARRLRVSLKRLMPKPFEEFRSKYKEGDRVKGVVTSLTDFGAFVRIGQVEGLLHNEDASWNKNEKCKNTFKVGDEIEVEILKIDTEKEKISLGRKNLIQSPIQQFAASHKVGDVVEGTIRDIKEFGIFVRIQEGVDALMRHRDLSAEQVAELKIGDKMQGEITLLDTASGKIRLTPRLANQGASEFVEEAAINPLKSALKESLKI
ncbi:MAG: 30S ribosomal protein S1 [Campylobacterales bacterium]